MSFDPRKTPMMITDLDERLLRDGIALAVAEELRIFIRRLTEMQNDLGAAFIVERAAWDDLAPRFAAMQQRVGPAMEYAKCFMDQWPDAEEEAGQP